VRLMRSRTFLLVMMTLLMPVKGSGELAELAPPPANAPFDDLNDAALQAEVTRQALAFLDTLHRHWGQGPEQLRTIIADPVEREEGDTLIYLRNVHEHGVLEGYEFRKGSLTRGRYLLLQGPLNGLNEFIGYYTAVKQALNAAYGDPAVDRVVWNNDLYAPLPDYWGVAVMIGHLQYHATWETAEGRLTLDLTGNRYSRLSIDYRMRGEQAHT
jgi:hypothetical protein